jgi:hypothetical protein
MNRTFSLIALQSAVAAAIVSIAPVAGAATTGEFWTAPQEHAFTSTASRADVRQEAVAALRSAQRPGLKTRSDIELPQTTFVASANRDQVRAEAREAVRLGLTQGYESNAGVSSQKLEQIRLSGLRATAPELSAAAR